MMQAYVRRFCVAAVLIGCMGAVVQGEVDSYSLLVQPSPANGGVVSPEAGIHRIRIGDPVTLQAVAKPGYRFLYWLGDVSDSSTNQAVVVLDAPKIVVAVFGRLEYELMETGGGGSAAIQSEAGGADVMAGGSFAPGGGAGGDSLIASAGYTGGGALGGGRPPRAPNKARVLPFIPNNNNNNGGGVIVVPGDGDDDIVAPGDGDPTIPEPATIALLGIGALLFLRPRPR